MAGLTLFAGTTAAAISAGDPADIVAGVILLLLCAAGSAIACSARNKS
ncbi:hypothetical protein [Rhodovastum atsumiense]|nr:hypothetical protein [Rhodovastum atsumiense]